MIRLARKLASGIAEAAVGAYSGFTGGYTGRHFDATDISSPVRSSVTSVYKDSKDTWKAIDRLTLLGVARRIRDNVGFVKGAIGDIRRFSVGEGILCKSTCEDKAAREAYDAFFSTWGEIGEVTQKFDARIIDGLISETVDTDGDLGILLTETSGKYPQIQIIEGHCIGDRNYGDAENGYYDGVKLNSVGRPVAYRIRRQIEEEEVFETVLARDFIHVFEPRRFDGVRGVTSLAHGIHHILDKKDTLSLIKLGIKVDSAMGVAIIGGGGNQPTFGRQTQSSNAGSSDTGAAAAPNTYEEMQGGALFKLEKGMDVKAITSDRPSPNVQTFLSYIDRDVATGLEVPIEFIWDSSSLGGSGNRFILKKAERKFADRQALIARVKRRIRNYVIAKGIKNFGLPYVDDWWKVRFQFPSRITVDVGREADANREDVYAGLRTEQSDYEERGEDFYEARNDIQEAADDLLLRATQLVQKYGKDGLTLEMAIQMMVKRGNSGSQPANQQNAKQPQDKGAK